MTRSTPAPVRLLVLLAGAALLMLALLPLTGGPALSLIHI